MIDVIENLRMFYRKVKKNARNFFFLFPKREDAEPLISTSSKGFGASKRRSKPLSPSMHRHFQASDTDVVLATIPKSGTTLLNALAFAVVNRKRFAVMSNSHPLLASNPHDLVPFFEYKLYANGQQLPDLSNLPQPRLFGTHVSFSS